MKVTASFLFLFILCSNSRGQVFSSDFKTAVIHKKIKEIPEQIDFSSPLNSFVTYNYILINGKNRLLRIASSGTIKYAFPDTTTKDSKVSEEAKLEYFNTTISEIITYKDSVAFVLSQYEEPFYSIRSFYYENGKWLSVGETGRNGLENARGFVADRANLFIHVLRRYYATLPIPRDTISFISYLKEKGKDPKNFVLDKLNKYKLVLFGEIHRRKVSWDFLESVANDKRFGNSTGTIFLELGSHKQHDIDSFLSKVTIDRELLLNIFREYLVDGWNDKGKFDFIITIWKINKKLPSNKKIKIILIDTPRPFSTYRSREDLDRSDSVSGDRDEYMARAIFNYLAKQNEKRNALFIVGAAHVGKTLSSSGHILSKKLPDETYTIFTHCPQVDNFERIPQRIRYGMFDYAFYKNNNHPVAFELTNSPFGKEPFDGLHYEGSGSFKDNYDGYIVFGSLDLEPSDEMLLEEYNDKFILEMDRRYRLIGSSLMKAWHLKELSQKAVIEKLLSEHTKTRWENYIKPLKNGVVVQ